MTDADDDLAALQAAATHYDIDPTEPGAEEWLRGSPHYRWTRFGLAARRMGQQIIDAVEPLRTVFAMHNMADPEETP